MLIPSTGGFHDKISHRTEPEGFFVKLNWRFVKGPRVVESFGIRTVKVFQTGLGDSGGQRVTGSSISRPKGFDTGSLGLKAGGSHFEGLGGSDICAMGTLNADDRGGAVDGEGTDGASFVSSVLASFGRSCIWSKAPLIRDMASSSADMEASRKALARGDLCALG